MSARNDARLSALGSYEWRRNGGHLSDDEQTPEERAFWRGVDAACHALAPWLRDFPGRVTR